jgi:hypothetical protein
MATIVTKRSVRTKSTAKRAASKAAATRVTMTPRSVALAGIGAGASAIERAQSEAVKVYSTIIKQAGTLRSLTGDAADKLAAKTGMFVRKGKKIQNKAALTAQAQANDAAKEVKAFAKKSQKALEQNVSKSIDAAVANAKEGVTRLEHVFETRVARTLNTFGVPSAKNIRELQTRMADLQKVLNQLNSRGARA